MEVFVPAEFPAGETIGGESRRGSLPVSSSIAHFLYTVGIPRAKKELETFDLDCKTIHFVATQIWAALTPICNQLSEILGGPWRNDRTSRKWGTQEGTDPSTIILDLRP